MNKQDFIKAVANKINATQKDTKVYLDGIIDVIYDSLASGEPVNITGFGKFEVVERSARTGHNPLTGEQLDIPASKAPKFRPSSSLKDVVKKA